MYESVNNLLFAALGTLRIAGVAPLTPQIGHYREWLKSADMAALQSKECRTQPHRSGGIRRPAGLRWIY
ncbi:hypothetical protein KCP78_00445 [Salmonella enterica subsp. enterica]|nr:hypothetical protein KCP78_00445 [Salmonella enterica subsp. enterica]